MSDLARVPDEALDRLAELFRDADAEIARAAPRCELSGVCCDFDRCEHVLYATDLEVQFLLARTPIAWRPAGKLCPFWRERLCVAREGRPLGCRVYFCDPAFRERMPEIAEAYQKRLRELHDAFGIEYRYRPLVETLRTVHEASARD